MTKEMQRRLANYLNSLTKEALAGDDERAHGIEDSFYIWVLRQYSEGYDNPDLAEAALQTQKLNFSRWTA